MWSNIAILKGLQGHLLAPVHYVKSSKRLLSAAVSASKTNAERTDPEWTSAKSFNSIPGPGFLEVIRLFLPGGELYNKPYFHLMHHLHDTYGTVCRIPAMFGRPTMVFTFDPILNQKTYNAEGIWPNRPGMNTFDYYRKNVRPEIFKDVGGLISDQGEPWYKLRTKANPILMAPKTVKSYVDSVDVVTREFVEKIGMLRDKNNEMPEHFGTEMKAWAFEAIGVIALDRRLGAIAFKREPDVENLMQILKDFVNLSYELDIEPSVWRYISTRRYRKLMATFDAMTNVIKKFVDEAVADLEKSSSVTSEGEPSVLQKLLKIDKNYAIIMTFDMLFGGVDSTSNAIINFFYLLAKNPEKQEILRAEVFKLLPHIDSKFTQYNLDNAPYFRGALKESMRMLPINPANVRAVNEDVVLNGYQIPKNTDIYMGQMVLHNHEKYFANSDQFQPERFIRAADGKYPSGTPDHSPFAFLPFGFGSRMCIGKRFAELEAQLLTFRLLREYRIEWHHGPFEFTNSLIVATSNPLRFKMVPLNAGK